MIYGFDTDDTAAGTGALLLYAIYRSRDRRRYKVTPDLWERVERFVKASAKRARTLPQFIEAMKPRLDCGTLDPRWMAVGDRGSVPMLVYHDAETGRLSHAIQRPLGEAREFLAGVLARADHRAVLRSLYCETAWVVMLVRDRLEREKPIEADLQARDEEEEKETVDA